MVDAQEVQDRRVQIVNLNRIVCDIVTEFVRRIFAGKVQSTTDRVTAKKCALGTTQDFQSLHVGKKGIGDAIWYRCDTEFIQVYAD